MISLADTIAGDLADPVGRDLQERLLQAMFLMERFRGVDAGWREVVAEIAEADISEQAIARLTEALEKFIREYPKHSDAGSAVWALGKLHSPAHIALFAQVADPKFGYDDWARKQALCALENHGYERKTG